MTPAPTEAKTGNFELFQHMSREHGLTLTESEMGEILSVCGRILKHRNIVEKAVVINQGYVVELASRGPWLKRDLTWTPDWGDRGIWPTHSEAERDLAISLQTKRTNDHP